ALTSLSVTQLTGPFPTAATVTAAHLNNAGRALVSVDGGVGSIAGNALVQKDVIAGNRVGWSSSGEFVTADGLAQEIRRGPILRSARSSTMSTALGLLSVSE